MAEENLFLINISNDKLSSFHNDFSWRSKLEKEIIGAHNNVMSIPQIIFLIMSAYTAASKNNNKMKK